MTEFRGVPNGQSSHHPGQRTCRPVPLASDPKLWLAEIGVHASPSRDDRSADLLDKSADDPAATTSVARLWRHEGHQ